MTPGGLEGADVWGDDDAKDVSGKFLIDHGIGDQINQKIVKFVLTLHFVFFAAKKRMNFGLSMSLKLHLQ